MIQNLFLGWLFLCPTSLDLEEFVQNQIPEQNYYEFYQLAWKSNFGKDVDCALFLFGNFDFAIGRSVIYYVE
jgi:hypothetical protein